MRKLLLLTPLLLASCLLTAQSLKTTNGERFVLVEKATGAWCGFCSDGNVKLNEVTDLSPRVIAVAIHAGGGSDNMKIPDGLNFASAHGISGFPQALIDRVSFGKTNDPALGRADWKDAVNQRLQDAPDFDIELKHGFNATTRDITALVTATALKSLTGNYTISLYIVEDELKGSGAGWDQYNYSDGVMGHPYYQAGNPITGFTHNHVLRQMLGGNEGITGAIPLDPAANATGAQYFSYNLPQSINWEKTKLVAIVRKSNPSDKKDRVVGNSIESDLSQGPAIESNVIADNEKNNQFALYPNPAKNVIYLQPKDQSLQNSSVLIRNMQGQTIEQLAVSSPMNIIPIELGSMPAGLYFITLKNESGTSTRQFMVAR